MGSRISKSKKRTTMNSTISTLALLCAGMVLLCNVDQATGTWDRRLCSTNYYYTNYDCRDNCRVCDYKNCDPKLDTTASCGADYDDDDQVGEGIHGKDQGGEESSSNGDEAGGDYGADYDHGMRKRHAQWNQPQQVFYWQPILCSTNYYYTNYDCRQNCRVCQYGNCDPRIDSNNCG